MVSEAVYRHEYKYFINAGDCEILERRLPLILRRDKHTGPDGRYVIRSLYFDNYEDRAYFEKVNGTNPRQKFRIRIYNGDDSFISLEKKVKRDEMTQKIQTRITKDEYFRIVEGDIDWMRDDGRGVVAELYAQMKGYSIGPKTLVEYTRTPFIYDAGNVRVTVDRDLRTGIFSHNLFDPTPLVRTEAPDLLEVKFDRFLPEIVKFAVNPVTRARGSMSKYEMCRRFG